MPVSLKTAVLGIAIGFSPIAAIAGPISPWYLTGERGQVVVVQGDAVVGSWTVEGRAWEQPIAVTDVVRTMGSHPGYAGHEYAPDGTPTGTTYAFPLGGGCFFDGASDGRANYSWDFCTGAAYAFDSEWANPVQLFRTGVSDFSRLGITFDPFDHSLWLLGWNSPIVEHRTLTGDLLGSFAVAATDNVALALDPADGTLWMGSIYGVDFHQYSRTGQLLSSASFGAVGADLRIRGGEFSVSTAAPVPEPSTFALLSTGALTLLGRRRRRP